MEKGGRGEVGSASTMEAAVLIALLYALLAHELVSGLVARRVLASKPACKPVRPIWSEDYFDRRYARLNPAGGNAVGSVTPTAPPSGSFTLHAPPRGSYSRAGSRDWRKGTSRFVRKV
ncbi:uncharacterized protein LOC144937734 [Lampetra fluviatilis]